ncbi:MAG: lipopolysaccharide transport system permease protein [Candidatus Omnitrophota bacterium]|jgi:lipopolysaccharide transport system permease protein
MTRAGNQPDGAERITIREPRLGRMPLDLREVWRYSDLLGLMVWRNTVVRYKQSVLGIGWALIRPVVSMIVFSIIFGRIAKLPSDGTPYPIFTYVALLPWTYFTGALSSTSSSLVGNMGLLQKVYFPRLILPLSSICMGLVDFAVSFLVLIGLMIYYHDAVHLTWGVALLPFFLLLAMMVALAFGLWLSALMVKFRDIQYMVPFLTQIWMYLSPVAYTATLIPPKWQVLYALNPMTGVINGFRWALLGKTDPDWMSLGISVAVTLVILVSGLYFFRMTERTMVDVI